MSSADLSYLNAASIVPAEHDRVHLVLVGTGGTGSYVARPVAQIGRLLIERGVKTKLTFVDPDIVESKNVPRQLFAHSEIGLPKAHALARRYSGVWGIPIAGIQAKYSDDLFKDEWNELQVLIGCVDNAAARLAIAKSVEKANQRRSWEESDDADDIMGNASLRWWIDCGNGQNSGQVLAGTSSDPRVLKRAFPVQGICIEAPIPSLQAPDLLIPDKDELQNGTLSCAELMMLNLQDQSVNARIAAEASDFLMRLLVTRNLKRFATYMDLPSGVSRSVYCTPEAIAPYTTKQKTVRTAKKKNKR